MVKSKKVERENMFLMTLDKKGKIVIVPYLAKLNASHTHKRIIDEMIHKKNKNKDRFSIW